MDKDLKFLLPIICDASRPKVLIFLPKRLAAVTGVIRMVAINLVIKVYTNNQMHFGVYLDSLA